jgi:hypothetical protein
MICELEDKIFELADSHFDELALEIFRYQFSGNAVYRSFCDALNIDCTKVQTVASIPFMPVSFFKQHQVVTGSFSPEVVFESSGTTSTGNSRHFVRSLDLYRESFVRCFEKFYGDPRDWCIIGLLPSYLERKNSSLVLMVDELILRSGHPANGFYLYDFDQLASVISANEEAGQKTLLVGVTYALLDFAAHAPGPLKHTTIMETGGMKGRKKEMTREEVHARLKEAWQLEVIHSEYGMTELLSQAYSRVDGFFQTPSWMRILAREEDDPLTIRTVNKSGVVTGLANIIDLANIHSCAFIAVDDIIRLHPDNSFEVLGRMDSSDVRGCSLMYGS